MTAFVVISCALAGFAQVSNETGTFVKQGSFTSPQVAAPSPPISPTAFSIHVHNPAMTLPTIPIGGLRIWGTGTAQWNTIEGGTLMSPTFDFSGIGDETAGTGWIGYAKQFNVDLIFTFGQVPRFGSVLSVDSPANFPIAFPVANNGISWSGSVATVTTLQRQNSTAGDSVTIAGATGCPFTINSTFTLTLANNPTDYPWTYSFNVTGATGSGNCGGSAATITNNAQTATRCKGTGAPPNGQGGGCYSPYDVAVDGTGPDAFLQAFETAFITYLVAHDPMHRMKYWEMWNEPQGPGYFNGSIKQMARMQRDTYNLIAASARPDIILTSPAPSGGLTSPAAYLGLFAADSSNPLQYAKQIDFHSYNFALTGSQAPNPGDVLTIAANVRVAIAPYIAGRNLPFVVSEGSWGEGTWSLSGPQGPNTGTTAILNHADWVALWETYHVCAGISRQYWFAWDQNNGSGLITGTTMPIGTEPSATGWAVAHDWLANANLVQTCRQDLARNWTVQVARAGGYLGTMLWNLNLTTIGSYTIPAGVYTQYRDISGNVHLISPTQTSVPVQADPIFLETGPPPFKITSPIMMPSGLQGAFYMSALSSSGGSGASTYSELTLPSPLGAAGLSLDPATGDITGTPSTSGNLNTTVWALDAAGSSYTQNIVINVAASSSGNLDDLYCPSGDSSCNFGGTDGPAQLPITGMSTDPAFTPSPGSVLTATSCADFSSKLAAAIGGETIVLPAVNLGCGPITLPVAPGVSDSQWVTIKTDQTGAPGYPAYGVRATPCQIGIGMITGYPLFPCTSATRLMPQITCNTTNCQAITAASGASFYRLEGLEVIGPSSTNSNNYLVGLNNSNDHIVLSHMAIHGQPNPMFLTTLEDKGGISTSGSTNLAIVDSWVWDFMCVHGGACTDSQAIAGGLGSAGGGPIKAVNDFLSASGETWLFGGGTATATPCDLEFRRNHSFKPISLWFLGSGATAFPIIKNLGEVKNACRVLYEADIFEGDWAGYQGDQFGTAILATPKNQSVFTSGVVNTASPNALTATMGSFPSTTTRVELPAGFFTVTSWIDSTHVHVTPDPGNNTGLTASHICVPGADPTAVVANLTIRYSMIMHVANGMGISTALSDCQDQSMGIHFVSVHDVVLDDVNGVTYTNATSPCCGNGFAFKVANDHPSSSAWPNDIEINHVTALTKGWANGKGQGLFYQCDSLVGSSGTLPLTYFKNITIINSIGSDPAIGFLRGGCGQSLPGAGMAGTLAGNECSDNNGGLSGGTCTWTFAKNLLPTGVFTSQSTGSPYPSTNSICGTVTMPTCFPSSGFTFVFANYNNGNGGDYHLATGSPYKNQGTDGLDLGAQIDLMNGFLANVN